MHSSVDMLRYCSSRFSVTLHTELRLCECFYIFLNTKMNKGLQNPVASCVDSGPLC